MAKLTITDLHAEVDGKEILKGINLTINEGETVALLGPNGHGKSTLLNVIMGHPKYKVTKGSIYLDDVDILSLTTDERAKAGLFLGMQLPSEVPGVINSDFLRAAVNARNEILQLMLLNPKIAMLDEIDSGLDVDAIQTVADVINKLEAQGKGFLVISHYARLFDLIKPTRSIVIVNGKIVLDGDPSLIKRIDQTGYEFIKTELGINIEKEESKMNEVSIGSCAVRESIKK